jgi:CrcB protein
MTWFIVFIGGGLGSMARYAFSHLFAMPAPGHFPVATLSANLTSSFIAGLFIGFMATRPEYFSSWRFLVVVGFCGGFSTFSAFSAETFELIRHGMLGTAVVNVIVNVTGTLLLTGAGWWLGKNMA